MSNIPGSAHPCFGLGGLTLTGGLVGFLRKGSKASLGAGVVCGGLLIGSGVLIVQDKHLEGHALATGTSMLMSLGMGHRYIKTGKVMPAGAVAALGTLSVAYHMKKVLAWAA